MWKTSVHAAVGYGIEAQGMAPQRMRTLRSQLARHGGLQKGGSMDIVFDQHGKLQDPRDTAIERQLKAMHQLLQAWPPAQRGELVSAGGLHGGGYKQQRILGWWLRALWPPFRPI